MDKKTFGIGLLSITGLILFIANMMPLQSADAATAVKERDFTLVTAEASQGGEALYIVDNREGQIAVFFWDNTAHTLKLRALKPILDMFHN